MEIFVFPSGIPSFPTQKERRQFKGPSELSLPWLLCRRLGRCKSEGQEGPVVLAGTRPGTTAT